MNEQTRMMLAKKNKCDPQNVNCGFCFYKDFNMNYCKYHKATLLNFDEACYKFKHVIKSK